MTSHSHAAKCFSACLALGLAGLGCRGAGPATAAGMPSSPNQTSETTATTPARGETPSARNAELATEMRSPVSGPALEDLPPLDPRGFSRTPIELENLAEPPRLVVDGHGHTSKIRNVHYTSDGRSLVSSGYDKTVRIWSATTGELRRTIRGEIGDGFAGRIYASALSPNDRHLALGGWLGRDPAPPRSTGNGAFAIRLVDFNSGEPIRLLRGHTDVVLALAFSHDGQHVLSGGGDQHAIVWKTSTSSHARALSRHQGSVLAVAWAPDDQLVATASADRNVRVFDPIEGSERYALSHPAEVRTVTFTPSGRSLVTGTASGEINIWDVSSGEHLATLAQVGASIGSLTLSPNGAEVLVTTTEAPFASYVYNINSKKRLSTFLGHDNVVLSSAISPNGRWAVTAGGNSFELKVWDLKTGQSEVRTGGHGRPVWNVGFSQNGEAIAWGQAFQSDQLSPYQLNGPLTHRLQLTPGKDVLQLAHVRHDQTSYVRANERAGSLELRTPTGKEHEQLDLWSAGRRRVSIRRDVSSGFVHRAFSLAPGGRFLVSGGDDGVLSSFDASNGRKLQDYIGHTGDILALAISLDEKRLLSGSRDQTVKLWDIPTGALLLTLFPSKGGQWVAFTPAGYYASSAYGDSEIGWHLGSGPKGAAAYYPAHALSTQLRSARLLLRTVELSGRAEEAINIENELLPPGETPFVYFRYEDLPQFAPPEVYFLDPGNDLRIAMDRLEVTARAHSSSGEPITDLAFLVNGRPIDALWQRQVSRPRLRLSGTEAELTSVLPLPDKRSRISVIASNRYNQSEPVSFDVERTGGPKELEKLYQPKLHLLAVGISDYGSPELTPLSYADDDARAWATLLIQQNKKLYKSVETRVLTEREASRANLSSGLNWLRRESSPRDLAIVFLSGYSAMTPEGDYYFLTHDADPKRPEETALSWRELREALGALPARTLLLLDSSHAGRLTDSPKEGPFDLDRLLRNVPEGSSLAVMSSSTGVEASYESDSWRHGAFTKALLEGTSGGADYDHDRRITINELEHFVHRRVRQLTRDLQHPTTLLPPTMLNFSISDY